MATRTFKVELDSAHRVVVEVEATCAAEAADTAEYVVSEWSDDDPRLAPDPASFVTRRAWPTDDPEAVVDWEKGDPGEAQFEGA